MTERTLIAKVTRKDLDISWFSGHGPGGQHRNRNKCCVRLRHRDSGATATGQEYRSRNQNLRAALKRLTETPEFKLWLARKAKLVPDMAEIEREVDRWMTPENLVIEKRVNGKWVPYDE